MTQHPAQPPSMEWQPASPPAPQPPPEQRSWFARHKILTAILAVLLLVVIASALGGGGDDEIASPPAATQSAEADEAADAADPPTEAPAHPPAEPTEEPPAEPDTPGIGDPVRDGAFEFVVTGVEDGGTEVGDEFLSESAQGRFHLVHITVTNIGDEAQMMFDSNQQVRDEQGRSFEANSTAGIYLDGNDLWLQDINPGNSVSGTIVFDMPEGASPVEIELHDSAFSGGVTVALS